MRQDIQALRALAVALVLLWHAGVPGIGGGYAGVDVFFVLSGFLMTRIVLGELAREGRVDLPRFYLRRARRLFPAAGVLLVATALLTLLLPVTRWRGTGLDIAASAAYLVNWRLAASSVDYLAQGSAASPVQHFWTLAVEEQFYLLWPLLLAGAALLLLRGAARRSTRALHRAALVPTVALLGASLAWSVHLTDVDPQRAYLVTTTRGWELALGGLVAVAWPWWEALRPGARVGAALTVAGLGAIGAAAVLLGGDTPYPGSAALLPTLGTAAVLLGGDRIAPGGVLARLVALPPVRWVGDASYSLYLWHWPPLVLATHLAGGRLGWGGGLAVTAASALPAWLSFRYVEQPFRGRVAGAGRGELGRRLARWVLGFSGLVGAVGLVLALLPGLPGLGGGLRPLPAEARHDAYQPFYDGCPELEGSSQVTVCVGGDPGAQTTVALVGDSHAVMWMSALDAAGAERGWRVELMARPSCPVAQVVPVAQGRPNTTCPGWREAVLAELAARPRDVVVTAQVSIYPLQVDEQVLRTGQSDGAMADGLVEVWRELGATGADVVSVLPTARFPGDRSECVAEHLADPSACDGTVAEVLAPTQVGVRAALDRSPQVLSLDVDDLLCPDGVCRAVQDDVLVFTDNNHVSRTWMLEHADEVGRRLAGLTPRL